MTEPRPEKTFFKALGPGLLWAGAAIGVSHLVQSTRAGAKFGFGLLVVVLLANVFKYPGFSFGPRYAAATGTSLLEGYRRRGRFGLVLYAIVTIGAMFTIQAVVTIVTGGIGAAVIGWTGTWLAQSPAFWMSLFLTAICAGLLYKGRYRWLDKIVKVVVLVLTLSTLLATILLLPRIPWGRMSFLPGIEVFKDPTAALFVAALVGWMPSAFDISIWHSLWTLARRRDTGHAPTVRESLIDFNIGYLGTAVLAFCFLTLGAGVFFASGKTFSNNAVKFSMEVIGLYEAQFGAWSRPIIGLSVFTVMFSTTLTVIDGFPRALACLFARFKEPEVPDRPTDVDMRVYWLSLGILGVGSLLIIRFGGAAFKTLIDFATTLAVVTSPGLAVLNHLSMFGSEVPEVGRPGRFMWLFSWSGIVFASALALWFLYVRFLW